MASTEAGAANDHKLVIAIVQDEDANSLNESLTQGGFGLTRINTAGGFLRQGNVSFLIGTPAARLAELLTIIRANCQTRTQYVNPIPPIMEPGEFYIPYPVEVQVGGANVFVIDLDRHERI